MTALETLARLRMEEAEVLRTECASCHHLLREHRLASSTCIHFDVVRHVSGDPSRARLRHCGCKDFRDPAETLALE